VGHRFESESAGFDTDVCTSLTRIAHQSLALLDFRHHSHIQSQDPTQNDRTITTAMLPSLHSLLVLSIASSPTITAHIIPNNPPFQPNQRQQPLQQPPTVLTTTLHTTVTSYASTSMITATLTRYTADDTTDVPAAVQTWYGAQRTEGCDRTACASCRVWYECEGTGVIW
jgi:hypothetical protein